MTALALLLAASSICFDQTDPFDVDRVCVHWRAKDLSPWTNSNNITCYQFRNNYQYCANGKFKVPLESVPWPPPGEVYYFLLTSENENGRSITEHEGDTQ